LDSTKNVEVKKKTVAICLAIILCAVAAANFWRLSPPDPDCVRAAFIYKEILRDTTIIGLEYSLLTTSLGSYAAKKTSENPVAAALMVRLLKDAGVSANSVVAVNASGSFPGFTLASLSACAALGVKTYVIVSIGASTYGANIPGNTIADILLADNVFGLGFSLLAVTPGGTNDLGREIDPEELERISEILLKRGIPFIRPKDLADAVALRESLFSPCTLLVNVGGNHASIGDDVDLALMAGIIKPDKAAINGEPALVRSFLALGKPVIQILNVRKLYAGYGLDFDKGGKIIGNTEKLFRRK